MSIYYFYTYMYIEKVESEVQKKMKYRVDEGSHIPRR